MSARARPDPGAPIRPAQRDELDRLAELYALLAGHHAADGPRFALRLASEDLLRAHLAEQLRDPQACVLVAAQGRQLPGFCIARRCQRPAFFSETERVSLDALWVRPDCRRQGLGRALVEAALARLDPSGRLPVELEVARSNPEGRSFWRCLGFEPAMDVMERRQ